MRIIGFAGAGGSGKTTAAGFLAMYLSDQGMTVKLDAFAVPVKADVRRETGEPFIDKDRDREAMQRIGTVGRESRPDWYIDALAGRNGLHSHTWRSLSDELPMAISDYGPADFLIVTDVRFPNEADFCKRYGMLVMVSRRRRRGERPALSRSAAHHESESHGCYLRQAADVTIAGGASLERLRDQMRTLAREILLEWHWEKFAEKAKPP